MTCASCATPMAPDQRYCLTCGARATEARLPFLDALRPGETVPVPHGAPLAAGGVRGTTLADRLRVDQGLLAGAALLLLALVAGVLIGAGIDDEAPQAAVAPAPATQVIRLEGGAAPVAAAASTTPEDTDATTTSGAKPSSAKSGAGKSKAKAAPRATNSSVKKLDGLTGAAAVKAADKLGKTVVVGGKPPKKDAKPAGGGGSFEEIG